ncbi:MAG: PIN domain-containing protein [Deltaproteobacteria bacterium]|nr:PIN domain-containing protein [Deltaproteobacteria bacterium]
MKTLFVDTSAFYALFNRDDPNHRAAAEFYRTESCLLVTTHAVFTELMSLITKRQGKRTAIQCGTAIKAAEERIRVADTSDAQNARAWQLFCKYKDKQWDLIDCTSFVFMEDTCLKEAFAFDRHFAQSGFRSVPIVP